MKHISRKHSGIGRHMNKMELWKSNKFLRMNTNSFCPAICYVFCYLKIALPLRRLFVGKKWKKKCVWNETRNRRRTKKNAILMTFLTVVLLGFISLLPHWKCNLSTAMSEMAKINSVYTTFWLKVCFWVIRSHKIDMTIPEN